MAGNNAVDSGGIGGAKMIDLSKIAYRLTVMDSGGKQYNIKEFSHRSWLGRKQK